VPAPTTPVFEACPSRVNAASSSTRACRWEGCRSSRCSKRSPGEDRWSSC
jgi:hypothetical protein